MPLTPEDRHAHLLTCFAWHRALRYQSELLPALSRYRVVMAQLADRSLARGLLRLLRRAPSRVSLAREAERLVDVIARAQAAVQIDPDLLLLESHLTRSRHHGEEA
jgi:hypothetical protein